MMNMKKKLAFVLLLPILAACGDDTPQVSEEVSSALEGEIAVNEERLNRLDVADELDADATLPPDVKEITTPTGLVGYPYDSHIHAMSSQMDDFALDDSGNPISGVAITPYFTDTEVTYENAEVITAVSIEDAFKSGLGDKSQKEVQDFLNDPINLIVMPQGTNEARAGADASGWLPELSQCNYTKRQIDVKARYGLTVDESEKEAIEGTFDSCGKF